MRAINLMSTDAAGPSPRSASTATYVVLGVLAALLIVSSAWAIGDRQVGERRAQLAAVNTEAAAAEARAAATRPLRTYVGLADARVETVKALSAGRFDWGQAMRRLSRVLPADVYLTSMAGTSSGADTGADPAAAAAAPAPLPTFAVDGCTRSQSKVARLMNRLRRVAGVRRVELHSSEKTEERSAGAGACGKGAAGEPQFSMSIFYAAPGGDGAAAAAAAATTATTAPAPAPAAAGAAAPTPTTTPPSGGSEVTAR